MPRRVATAVREYVRASRVLTLCVCAAAIHGAGRSGSAKTISIQSIHTAKLPVVERQRVLYTMDIIFNREPHDYWTFFDSTRNAVVFDMYEAYIRSPYDSIPRSGPFLDIDVDNFKSTISPTGQQSQIVITIDRKWRSFRVEKRDGNVIRFVVAKHMISKEPRNKKRSVLLYLTTSLLASVATFLVIWAIHSQ